MTHLMRIEEISHIDQVGNILWKQENINNVFHINGQEFILRVCFNTALGLEIPTNYYLGLDNRLTLSANDNLTNLSQEPTQFGYTRQAVSSANGFSIAQSIDSNFRATSSIAVFSASGGAWGPVRNLFLATVSNNVGFLLSSAALDSPRTVQDGQSLTVRISIGLVNC